MSAPSPGLLSQIARWLARPLGGPVAFSRGITVATLSVAQTLLGHVRNSLATDLGRFKEAMIRKTEAEAALQDAEAQKRLAEATEAANRANLPKRRDVIAEAEKRKLLAETAKTEAEAEAIRMDAETRQAQAIVEAQAKLIDAISKLRHEGGELLVNPENLHAVIAALTWQPHLKGPDT